MFCGVCCKLGSGVIWMSGIVFNVVICFWGVIFSVGGIVIFSSEFLGCGNVIWNGVFFSDEFVFFRSEVFWNGGYLGVGDFFMLLFSWGIGYWLGVG